jgi:hypothetical protein
MVETDKICANCRHYKFKPRQVPEDDFGTWAFCDHYQTWFPNARGWMPAIADMINERRKAQGLEPAKFKKPGERTCSQLKA